jgi:hypothetical protein
MLVHEIDVLWAPTHPPSLKFCVSSSKAKPEAMQEIWDNTSVDPCSILPNESMWPYHAVPTDLIQLLWNFSSCLGWLKGGTFHPCLSYLASFWNWSERKWYYVSSILGTRALFLVCASSPRLNKCSFSSYPLKANMWSSWVKRKGTTQVMCIAKLNDGPKWVKKTFSMILGRFLEWYDFENGIT